MLISIVVPCFNEEAVIDRFHEHLLVELLTIEHEFEFVYVDDGSKDDTLSILKRLAGTDTWVRYVSFSRNFGKEAAMFAGLRNASGDAVIIMDADLQHPPELVGLMVELREAGHDQVIAKRTQDGDRVTRTWMVRGYYRLVNRLVDVELVDGVGDFRLLSRRAVNAVLQLTEYNRFSKGLFAWVGFPSVTFEYRNAVREEGQSKWTFSQLLNYGADGVISFNNKPLRAAVYLDLSLLSVAVLYAVWIVGRVLVDGVDTPGYATLLVVMTALAGVQMIMVGVIGEYIGRVYYEVKRRPHYLVQSTNVAQRADVKDLVR